MPDPADEGGLMNIEEEIARAVADAQNTPFVGSKQKRIATALMPLVKRAQAEATAAELRDLADMFVDQACTGWPHNVDIREAAEHFESMTLQRADRIEKEEVSDDE